MVLLLLLGEELNVETFLCVFQHRKLREYSRFHKKELKYWYISEAKVMIKLMYGSN